MADNFVGEIRLVGFDFAPKGWALCNGQLLPISQNTALFSLLGTFYGGDGRTNFALPNLQGMTPINQGQGAGLSDRPLGEIGGESAVTLTTAEIPSHTHGLLASATAGTTPQPGGGTWAEPRALVYGTSTGVSMNPGALAPVGGQPHSNLAPYLTLNYVIALLGIFPARS